MTFLDTVPDDVYVGIVTFDGEVDHGPRPDDQDRAAAQAVIDGLDAGHGRPGSTTACSQAVDVAGDRGPAHASWCSPTAPTPATPPLDDGHHGDQGRRGPASTSSPWTRTARHSTRCSSWPTAGAGPGDRRPTRRALQAAFAAEADVARPPGPGHRRRCPSGFQKTEATIEVTLPTSTGSVSAEAFTTGRAAAPSPSVVRDPRLDPARRGRCTPARAPVGLGLVILLVLAGAAQAGAAQRRRPGHRATPRSRPPAERRAAAHCSTPTSPSPRPRTTAANVLRRNRTSRPGSRPARGRRQRAEASEWLLCTPGSFFLAGLVGLLLGGGNLVIGFAVPRRSALFGPWFYLGFRRRRRRKAFNAGLPDTLQLMSGSLAAGLSLAQSVDTIVREGAEPIAVGVPAGAGRDPARASPSRTRSRASPSGSRARTSTGS